MSNRQDDAPLYPEQDHMALGDFYLRHVSAMTAEGLHAKSDIAAQLAWRDQEIAALQSDIGDALRDIASLQARLDAAEADAARYRWLRRCRGQEHDPLFTVQHELDGTLWGGYLDAAIDAAREQS